MRRVSIVLASVFLSLGCSSSSSTDSPTDAADETPQVDTLPYEEPILDGPAGVVVLLRPYDPANRCWYAPPTAVGHPDDVNADGTFKCKGTTERCYQRTDGIVFYSSQDCIHGGNFLMPITDVPYSDLGPCEPPKHLELSKISDCPKQSCVYARDVVIDLAEGCAEQVVSRDCRDVTAAATSCLCDPSSSNRVFVAYDGKSTTNAPTGFTACASTNPSCAKALAMADTVKPCAIPTGDAGADATSTDAADGG